MVLQTINSNKSWIMTNWKCTFPMRWASMLFATKMMCTTFNDPEVMAGDKNANPERINPNGSCEEKGMLRIRGFSTLFNGNVSVVLYTNSDVVSITVPKSIGFAEDYESLAKAIGPFMDSLELRMYAGK